MSELKFHCPTCNTSFEQYDLYALIEIIVDKINLNGNSLNSDYPITEYDRLVSIYNSLRSLQLLFQPPSNIMDSQNIVEDSAKDVMSKYSGAIKALADK